jgi:membrane protein implicated in regulation of membrane protease activity
MLNIWIITFLFFLLIEMGIPGLFFCLSIACGSLGGFVADFYELSFEVQIYLFCVGTFISFYLLHSFAIILQAQLGYKTGVERLKGSPTHMLTDCGLIPGTVHIAGTTWNAQSLHGDYINAGTLVRIIDIKNTTLIVQPIKET